MAIEGIALVFYDTISHPASDKEDNLDLIQFPSPLVIREIRIIPYGEKPGIEDSRLLIKSGSTTPPRFRVQFFVNNLSKPGASAFQKLGELRYDGSKETQFFPPDKIATDGLVIQGEYSCITVAVIAENVQEEKSQSPQKPRRVVEVSDDVDRRTELQPSTSTGTKPKIILQSSQATASAAVKPTAVSSASSSPPQKPKINSSNGFVSKATSGQSKSYAATSSPPEQSSNRITPHAVTQSVPTVVPVAASASQPLRQQVLPGTSHMGSPQAQGLVQPTVSQSNFIPIFNQPPPSLAPHLCAPPSQFTASPVPVFPAQMNPQFMHPPPVFDPSRPPPNLYQQQAPPGIGPQQQPLLTQRVAGVDLCLPSDANRSSDAKLLDSSKATVFLADDISDNSKVLPRDPTQLEDGEYVASDDDDANRGFDYENISDEEFEYNDIIESELDLADLNEDFLSAAYSQFDASRFEISQLKYFTPARARTQKIASAPETLDRLNDTEAIIKAFDGKTFDESWVAIVESLTEAPANILTVIMNSKEKSDLHAVVISWVLHGLDFTLASQQAQPVFMIRHMKAGIKLAHAVFRCALEPAIMLLEKGIQHRLLDLFVDEYMTIPMKLLILQALDASTLVPGGFNAFVSLDNNAESPNVYQRLLKCLINKQASRVVSAIAPLVNKVHFYQMVTAFRDHTRSLLSSSSQNREEEETAAFRKSDDSADVSSSERQTLKNIRDALKEVLHFCKNSSVLIVRSLQPQCVHLFFQLSELRLILPPSSLLESLFLLCSMPLISGQSDILLLADKLLRSFLTSQRGLMYLCSHNEVVSGLLQLLLQTQGDENQDISDDFFLQQLALELAYNLQALLYVDELKFLHSKEQKEVDNFDEMTVLRNLYGLSIGTNGNIGQKAVVNVLSKSENLSAIFPFVELTGDSELDGKLKKSACTAFACELLLLVIRSSASAELLVEFGEKFLRIAAQEATSKISELKQWTETMQKLPDFTAESVPYLVTKLKAHFTDGFMPKVPKGLITTLRILKYICIAPVYEDVPDQQEQLKYKYALVKLYEADALSTLFAMIEKFASSYLYQWQQGLSVNGRQKRLALAAILPALVLIRATLSYLIRCRNTEFKDTTGIVPLMQLFTVTTTLVPPTGQVPETNEILDEIIKTLLAYTQPDIKILPNQSESETDRMISESLWTAMIREILKFTVKSPCNFIGGLNALCELLPLQLPMQTARPLTESELQAVAHSRRLWSIHLLPTTPDIQSLIMDFASATFPPLQQSLRRFCAVLSDISAQAATTVARSFIDILLKFMNACLSSAASSEAKDDTPAEKKDSSANPIEEKPALSPPLQPVASADLSHTLNLVSSLISVHAPIKLSVLSLITNCQEYSTLMPGLLRIFNHASADLHHLVAQEYIMSILGAFCDEDISLIIAADADAAAVSLEQFASSLPPNDLMAKIVDALLAHVGNLQQNFATVLPALRTLNFLLLHDYGLYHIKNGLERERKCVVNLLSKLDCSFVRDSSDCLSTLSSLVDFLKGLYALPEDCQEHLRRKSLSFDFIKQTLEWQTVESSDDHENHPLLKLMRRLEHSKEDESLAMQFENIRRMIDELNAPATNGSVAEDANSFERSEIPEPMPLVEQFEQRQKWILLNDADEDRLSPPLWLPQMILEDDDDIDADKVTADLEALRLKFFPLYDLKSELLQCVSAKSTEGASKPRKPRALIISTASGDKRPYVAPLRGRGFGRGGMGGNRGHFDSFRNRPPNTSRPPSMHVDDFVQAQHMQQQHSQQMQNMRDNHREASRPMNKPFNDRFNARGPYARPGGIRGGGFRRPQPQPKMTRNYGAYNNRQRDRFSSGQDYGNRRRNRSGSRPR